MSEIDTLKSRIEASGQDGIKTDIIRDDYEPAGDMMIKHLVDSGEFITQRTVDGVFESSWKIFMSDSSPY